jgi:hypothetical protein
MTVGVALRGHPIPGDRSLIGVLIVYCEEGAATEWRPYLTKHHERLESDTASIGEKMFVTF